MEARTNGNNFIQEAFRGFLKCLGLDGGAGKPAAAGEEAVNSPPPSSSATNYEPLPAADETAANNPPADALSSPIDSTTMTTTDIDNNLKADQSNYTLVTIDEIINTSDGTTAEAHFVELIDDGQPKMSLSTTSLISSGGGGKSH
ncbi:uncharacterized protein LOC143634892 [Bidens hawaiensis]|uniref:uncharacterized protein LOC143634892 n=1 Tax=Bidens hawaiensis TaxID=980011 RepID=UPI00404B1238